VRRCVNRGGNYDNTANGFGSFNANNPRSNQNGNIGFRSASSAFGHDAECLRARSQYLQVKGSVSSIGSAMIRKKNQNGCVLLALCSSRSRMG